MIQPEGFSAVKFILTDEDGWANMLRWLVGHRKRARLTQVEIAKRMDITQSQVSDFERGQTDPHLSTVRRYMHALGLEQKYNVVPEGENPWARDE